MKETIERIGWAPITSTEDGEYETGTLNWLTSTVEGGREFKATPEGSLKEIYADGKVVYSDIKNSGYAVDVTTIAALDDIRVGWYGEKKTADGELLETDADQIPNIVLCVVEKDVSAAKVSHILTVFYYCFAAEKLTHESKTSEGEFDPVFPAHKFKARPRLSDGYIKFEKTFDTLTEALVTSVPEPTDTSD